MALYVAGQRIRASELNRLPQMYYVTSDITINNTTTFTNVTGLGFSADANGGYFIECFLFYRTGNSGAALYEPSIRFQWTIPAGTTGWHGASGTTFGSTSAVGSGNRQALAIQTPGIHAFAGDAGVDVYCDPVASCFVASTPGTVQLQFAQQDAHASNTIIRSGSSIRVTKLTS